jgi:hypothetical protein
MHLSSLSAGLAPPGGFSRLPPEGDNGQHFQYHTLQFLWRSMCQVHAE